MFPNLRAEQARRDMTDEKVAQVLNIPRTTYAEKKRSGRFNVSQCKALCVLFNCDFNYLFATNTNP